MNFKHQIGDLVLGVPGLGAVVDCGMSKDRFENEPEPYYLIDWCDDGEASSFVRGLQFKECHISVMKENLRLHLCTVDHAIKYKYNIK